MTDWLATQASPNTRTAYQRDLAAFAAWCDAERSPLLEVSTDDVTRYRDHQLRTGASPATVNRRLSGIASFFRHATAAGVLGANPAAGVDRTSADRPPRETLDGRELTELVAAAQAIGPKTAALVALVALDGMKLGEVLALDVDDVHLGRRSVSVSVARHGEPCRINLSDRSGHAMAAHLAGRADGPVFVGESPGADRPGRLTRFGADFLIKRAASAAGIDKSVSAGMLRRSYVGAARRAGTPIDEISRQVGHREVRETARMLEEQT